MNKIPKWVWAIAIAGGAYYLYNRYKSAAVALTSASIGQNGQPALPGTPGAINTGSAQIASGITQLFNLV
jgi:hypothetical protein